MKIKFNGNMKYKFNIKVLQEYFLNSSEILEFFSTWIKFCWCVMIMGVPNNKFKAFTLHIFKQRREQGLQRKFSNRLNIKKKFLTKGTWKKQTYYLLSK